MKPWPDVKLYRVQDIRCKVLGVRWKDG